MTQNFFHGTVGHSVVDSLLWTRSQLGEQQQQDRSLFYSSSRAHIFPPFLFPPIFSPSLACLDVPSAKTKSNLCSWMSCDFYKCGKIETVRNSQKQPTSPKLFPQQRRSSENSFLGFPIGPFALNYKYDKQTNRLTKYLFKNCFPSIALNRMYSQMDSRTSIACVTNQGILC